MRQSFEGPAAFELKEPPPRGGLFPLGCQQKKPSLYVPPGCSASWMDSYGGCRSRPCPPTAMGTSGHRQGGLLMRPAAFCQPDRSEMSLFCWACLTSSPTSENVREWRYCQSVRAHAPVPRAPPRRLAGDRWRRLILTAAFFDGPLAPVSHLNHLIVGGLLRPAVPFELAFDQAGL